jgi:vitamin B12 transporter
MHPILFLAAAMHAETIVVTASRDPVPEESAGVSATVIEREQLEALGLPMVSDMLRLVPGVSVATAGPRGTQTQLRIRGAEANHTLLFVDGIRFNDPASGNEARFELLTSDALSRIEVVRGPQSALWGSEALGGVIAVETAGPGQGRALAARAEHGSQNSSRASAHFSIGAADAGLSGSAGWLRSGGIDSFGSGGERDGFENRSASLKAVFKPISSVTAGVVAHHLAGRSEFDGFDPITFRRADTLDETRNRIVAVRGWLAADAAGWSLLADASYLDSANRNRLGDAPLNSTFGERLTAGAQASRSFRGHRVTLAAEREQEDFAARDQALFGGTDQDRSRSLTAGVAEWRAEWADSLVTDIAIRHDSFSAFLDATTLRATALYKAGAALTLHVGYGEGIAQPTFYDLYGFFPGSFVGNPDLRPESSKGFEAGMDWGSEGAGIGVTAFSNRLKNEIVGTFDPATFLSSTANVAGKSSRRGIELAARYRLGGFRLGANYTYLDADEPQAPGAAAVREVRRPRHSTNLFIDGSLGAFNGGASLAYVGKRSDTDFDIGQTITLDDYLLASLKVGYRVTPGAEAYVRVENALGADYQDVVGYNTPGRSVYAGLRLHLGR